jgi:putative endonuclease
MARSHDLGRRGEDIAAAYLRGRGWRILDRNWRFHHKELDLVAERNGVVAFVEVKARDAGGWGHPLEAITAAKRRDLIVAARAWVGLRGTAGQSYRFDAVAVIRGQDRTRVEHVEGAWRL